MSQQAFGQFLLVPVILMAGMHEAHDPGPWAGVEPDLGRTDRLDAGRVTQPQQPASRGRRRGSIIDHLAKMVLHLASPLGVQELVHDRIGEHARHRGETAAVHGFGDQTGGGEPDGDRGRGARIGGTGHDER